MGENALSEWNAVEARYHEKRGLAEGRRLGCQAQIMADVVIDVPPGSQVHKQVIRKAASARDIVMNPATRLYYTQVDEADMHAPSGDLERLGDALRRDWQIGAIDMPTGLLPALQPALAKGEHAVTVVLHKDHHDTHHRVLDVFPGYWDGRLYGL